METPDIGEHQCVLSNLAGVTGQPSRRRAGGWGADLDHQRLPQVPVPQLPGLWQEKVRLHL